VSHVHAPLLKLTPIFACTSQENSLKGKHARRLPKGLWIFGLNSRAKKVFQAIYNNTLKVLFFKTGLDKNVGEHLIM
jgi:hypothetical protein